FATHYSLFALFPRSCTAILNGASRHRSRLHARRPAGLRPPVAPCGRRQSDPAARAQRRRQDHAAAADRRHCRARQWTHRTARRRPCAHAVAAMPLHRRSRRRQAPSDGGGESALLGRPPRWRRTRSGARQLRPFAARRASGGGAVGRSASAPRAVAARPAPPSALAAGRADRRPRFGIASAPCGPDDRPSCRWRNRPCRHPCRARPPRHRSHAGHGAHRPGPGAMMALRAVVARDLRLAMRQGGGVGTALGFFLTVLVLIPLGIGPDVALLQRIATGTLWIALLLSVLLSADRIFEPDHDDGSLEIMMLGPVPLELIVVAKAAAHWLATALPMAL